MVKSKAKQTSTVSAKDGAPETGSNVHENGHSSPSSSADAFSSASGVNGGSAHMKEVADAFAGVPGTSRSSPELAEQIKELVRLAHEQGYLTYGDINEALPRSVVAAEELDEIC